MIEIPEAVHLARQLVERCGGKRIESVVAGATPHGFAWYYGDRERYESLAKGAAIRSARAVGGMVEARAGDVKLLFSEGAALRLVSPGGREPKRHQFLVRFEDGAALVVTIQMYGGMGVLPADWDDNPYYRLSEQKPSPLADAFDERHFAGLFEAPGAEKLSAKALLATEQRVPGLGNGVLQDILFAARINPRTKAADLGAADRRRLYRAVTGTLRAMTEAGGRDTELDLDGAPGGYVTVMSRTGASRPCPACGGKIMKEAYLGGSVYTCPACQPLRSSPPRPSRRGRS